LVSGLVPQNNVFLKKFWIWLCFQKPYPVLVQIFTHLNWNWGFFVRSSPIFFKNLRSCSSFGFVSNSIPSKMGNPVMSSVYLYNILGWSSFPSIHPSHHPSRHPPIQVPHPGRRRWWKRRRKEEYEWQHQQFIQMFMWSNLVL
jgi:hypothetical protein